MHPIITRDLIKARISDLHRQAERHALGLAARRARQAPTQKSGPLMPAHAVAELIRRVLTLLGTRRPERYPVSASPVRPGRPG